MKEFKKLCKIILGFQKYISIFLCLAVAFLVVYQVILRYVFKAPLMGIEELLLFPVIWLYFLGGANASYERNHIECGVIFVYIKKEKTLTKLKIFKNIISIVICSWLLYWAYWLFDYSLTKWKVSDLLYIPMFFGESAIFIGIVLMLLYTVIECADNLKHHSKLKGA